MQKMNASKNTGTIHVPIQRHNLNAKECEKITLG